MRWEKHKNISKDSEPAKHLKENLSHKFSRKILFVPPEKRIRKILQASEIALKRQISNEQIESKRFCYFVTVLHENFITFNNNYVYIKNFNHPFNFCVSKSFYYKTDDALLRKAFTDILNRCDIHLTYISMTRI